MTEETNWSKGFAPATGPHKPILLEERIEVIKGKPTLVIEAALVSTKGQRQSKSFEITLNKMPDKEATGLLTRNFDATRDELNDIATDIAVYVKLKTQKTNEPLEREIFWKILLKLAEANVKAVEEDDVQSVRVENTDKNKANIIQKINEAWGDVVEENKKTKTPFPDVPSDDVVQETIIYDLPELEKKAKRLQEYAVNFGAGDYEFPNEKISPIHEEAIQTAAELRRQLDTIGIAFADAWWHAAEAISDVRKVKLDRQRERVKEIPDTGDPEGMSLKDYHERFEKAAIDKPFLFRTYDKADKALKNAKAALVKYGKLIAHYGSPENKELQKSIDDELTSLNKALDIISDHRGLLQEIESSRKGMGRKP